MSATVLVFPRRHSGVPTPAPAPVPHRGEAAEVYLVEAEHGGWIVVEMAANGDSACYQDHCATRDEAMIAGRAVARRIGGRFLDDEHAGRGV